MTRSIIHRELGWEATSTSATNSLFVFLLEYLEDFQLVDYPSDFAGCCVEFEGSFDLF